LLPDHDPEAEHAVAFSVVQVMVDALPALTLLGFALRVITGGRLKTLTVAVCVAEPPLPVHVSSYSVVLVSASLVHVPLVATAPFQPPEAVQDVAFCAFQFKVVVAPAATVAEDTASATVGAGEITTTSADCEAAPPGPVQVSV
jgi:Flp pilus assembly protein protease CpaA